jgi:hypothetical protein
MSFTCSGTVTGWRAAGEIRNNPGNSRINSVLSIWRERSSGSGIYDRVGRIELGICGSDDPATLVTRNIYECTLPQTVSVQPGDIVGIQLPQENMSKFRLYFNSQGGQTNHVFNSHDSPFTLSQAISSEQASDQPQIILTVEPDIVPTTPVLPTTQPLPATTEASSTMANLPTTPPFTSTSMATTEPSTFTEALTTNSMAATTQPSTSTEALTTMDAATDPPATITGSPTTDTAVTTSVNSESTTAGSATTEIPSSASDTTDAQTPREGEAIQQRESNTATIAGAAVGAIIAILLVLIIVLLLVLVLRRQTRNGQKFTPSNNATIVNPVYDGKPIVPNLEGVFH